MKEKVDPLYIPPDDLLAQGDIFRIELVGPNASLQQRIFRTKDGQHGSVVFNTNCEGRIFSRRELDLLLMNIDGIGRCSLHTEPFSPTELGTEELVIVEGKLYKYFIIATQTCDICGKDRPPRPAATILPIIPLAELCKTEKIPFSEKVCSTIHDYIKDNCDQGNQLISQNEADYGAALRIILGDARDKAERGTELCANLGKIKNF